MILLTGGTGFIGRYVCSTLATHGKSVLALDTICYIVFKLMTVKVDVTEIIALDIRALSASKILYSPWPP